jgi:hypothetical protein
MSATVVAPFVGTLAASGSGSVESQKPAAVVISGIEYRYEANIDVSHALLTAFTITDADPSDGQTGVSVTLDAAAFATALAALMGSAAGGPITGPLSAGAAYGAALGTSTLSQTLVSEVTTEIADALNVNGVLEFLEANAVGNLSITVNDASGAESMANGINNANDLKTMFLQIPNRTTVITNETDPSSNKLPLAVGDKLSFVFDLNTSVAISQTDVDAPADDNAQNADVGVSSGNAPDLGLTSFTTAARRVEFLLTVA